MFYNRIKPDITNVEHIKKMRLVKTISMYRRFINNFPNDIIFPSEQVRMKQWYIYDCNKFAKK